MEVDPKTTSPVTIESGPSHWQILPQDSGGAATVELSGSWWTHIRRKHPDVRVRVCKEGCFDPVSQSLNWAVAKTTMNRKGKWAGRSGTWSIVLQNIPAGGPYRIETTVGSFEEGNDWRRQGQCLHFIGVGDVWLIAGQSNAEGYGRDPIDDPSVLGVHQYDANGWMLAAHGRFHHPWLIFAKKLQQELGYPIGLIPTAVGGSAVSEWDPGQGGALFARMKERVLGAGGGIKGCLWYQGESDTSASDIPKYKTRFKRFVSGLRKEVKTLDLPVITMQLNRVMSQHENAGGWDAIREIQRQLAHEIKNLFVFPVFESGLCDGIHNGSLGNMLIAQRAVATALGGVYEKDVPYLHPECVHVKKVSGKRLELYFENVMERLDFPCSLENGFPFVVQDKEGDVSIESFVFFKKRYLRIQLARALVGEAQVIGVAGACPSQVIPRDISGYRGMLAFTQAVA